MTQAPNIWNTGLPLVILGVLGWVVPRMLVPEDTRSHKRVALGVLAAVVALIAIAALVLVAFDIPSYRTALAMGGAVLTGEIALRGSALFAIAWAPMLLLAWFNMAQRVEALRGEDMARGDGA
ncbi:hypothetical protein [uncultured Tateyamaria sp.]|uniref:hypothetical protein n=1 Tax=uncultured Tateyamaria sp. TaxID=455651 RepID=UPI0026071911|nr:hypothetical protein [uncultured Tateyamaria sp.]